MGRLDVVIDDDLEAWLRDKAKRKGDISKIVEEALRMLKSAEKEKVK